jgi:hypothetical protein
MVIHKVTPLLFCIIALLPILLYAQGPIPIEVHPSSSNWWLGLRVSNDPNNPISGVEITDTATWAQMKYNNGICTMLSLHHLTYATHMNRLLHFLAIL